MRLNWRDRVNGLDTPSQAWARAREACLYGRMRLGKKSLGVYWATTDNLSDLVWVARHLVRNLAIGAIAAHELDRAAISSRGRWKASSFRRKAAVIFVEYDVQFPAGCL
jgi:hypothetical protein